MTQSDWGTFFAVLVLIVCASGVIVAIGILRKPEERESKRFVLPGEAREFDVCPACGGILRFAFDLGDRLECSRFPEDHFRWASDDEIELIKSRRKER